MLKFVVDHPVQGRVYLKCLMQRSVADMWIGKQMQGGIVVGIRDMDKPIPDNKSADHLHRANKPKATKRSENLCNVVKRQRGAVMGPVAYFTVEPGSWFPRPPKMPCRAVSGPGIAEQTVLNLKRQIAELQMFIDSRPRHHHLNELTRWMISELSVELAYAQAQGNALAPDEQSL